MTVTPWQADSDLVRRQTHGQVVRAIAVPGTGTPFPLALLPGSRVQWDDTRAPRVTASLVCRPVSAAQAAALDPRTGARVKIDAGYRRAGGIEDVWPLVDLGIRVRRRTRTAATEVLTLAAASDEALVIDASPTVATSLTAASTAAALRQVLDATLSPSPVLTVLAAGPAVALTPVTDRWSSLREALEGAGLEAWDNGLRAWTIGPRPSLAAVSVVTLATGATGTVTDLDDTVDRDAGFNMVLYRYSWRDQGVDQTITSTAYVASGPLAITGPAGRRIYAEGRDTPTTQATANAAAADVLSRMITRGETDTATAVIAWWLRPGHTATVLRPNGDPTRQLVQAVDMDLAAGRMTVTTRTPSTTAVAISTTTPPAGPVIPDPLPPSRQTYMATWVASASSSYRGTGAKRTDTTNAIQGHWDTNGNQSAVVLFAAANSSGSETGRSISQALAGAAVTKVEIYLWFEHWFSASGGTARIGEYAGTAIPATFSGASPAVESAGWPRAAGRWVDITAAIDHAALAAGQRGITLGPGIGTSGTYYGRAHGATDPSPPALRITYNR